jgi:signal transduction histidine kinase
VTPGETLTAEYAAALQQFLARPNEAGLQRAYELGRLAHTSALGVLDMAAIHHGALKCLVPDGLSCEQRSQLIQAAGSFFAESLSPFEMTHRTFREANAALRRLNEVLEEETKRIAHAVHDESGQLLASAHLALNEIGRRMRTAGRRRVQHMRDLLDQVEVQMRQLSHEVRPRILDDLGLIPALDVLAAGVSKRSGTNVVIEGTTEGRLDARIETALYRIVQESLTNATRHSQAKQVTVTVRKDGKWVQAVVRDTGVGFDARAVLTERGAKGLGLLGIRERLVSLGGTLTLRSAPGKGTEVVAMIPLEM